MSKSNPVAVFDALNSEKNSIVILTDMVDTDLSPIIISLKVDGSGGYNDVEIDSNFVTGYYGRDGFDQFIENNIKNNTVLFIDKNRAKNLKISNTLWLEQFKEFDSNTIIRKFGLKSNINAKRNINFSDRDDISVYEKLGMLNELESRNKKLIEDVDRLKEYIKLQVRKHMDLYSKIVRLMLLQGMSYQRQRVILIP